MGCAVGIFNYFWLLCSFPNFDENMHNFCSPISFLPDISSSLRLEKTKKSQYNIGFLAYCRMQQGMLVVLNLTLHQTLLPRNENFTETMT